MIGMPTVLATRQDWLHTHEYVRSKGNAELTNAFRRRLEALKATRCMKVLKEGIDKPSEEQTAEDFEDALDPMSSFVRSGFTEGEINQMIGELV